MWFEGWGGRYERKIFFRGWGEAITWWVIKYPEATDPSVLYKKNICTAALKATIPKATMLCLDYTWVFTKVYISLAVSSTCCVLGNAGLAT